MLGWGPATRIYLAAGATDMRQGFEGLYALVRRRVSSTLRHPAWEFTDYSLLCLGQ
jgi:hypothetical protein